MKTSYFKRSSSNISIATFYENHKANKYNYDPSYQREYVWNSDKQSFFIDSILKNFPIPPIFLRQTIDQDTGVTGYDVIDGKQRLTTIVGFIEGKVCLPNDFGTGLEGEEEGIEELNGLMFSDLDISKDSPNYKLFQEYKRRLWRYTLPIEFIDADDDPDNIEIVIKDVFDRLNRNGVPLTAQELRNAKYDTSEFLKIVKELYNNQFWINRLSKLDILRLEHHEFISDLLFVILLNNVLDASKREVLDEKYEEWVGKIASMSKKEIDEITNKFYKITEFMNGLGLDYEELKITGISHLYGLWCLSKHCIDNDISIDLVTPKIHKMFNEYLNLKNNLPESLILYKKTMSYNTRSRHQRKNRLKAILDYCNLN